MTQPFIKNIFFITLSCLIFFAELVTFALMKSHDLHLLLCLYIIMLTQLPESKKYAVPLLLAAILTYLDTHICGWSLLYTMPLIPVAHYLRHHLYVQWIIPYLLLIIALLINYSLIWYTYAITINPCHLLLILFYNNCLIVIGTLVARNFANSQEK